MNVASSSAWYRKWLGPESYLIRAGLGFPIWCLKLINMHLLWHTWNSKFGNSSCTCTFLCPGNDFAVVVVHAPSDLHFLFVWCTWAEEGHHNGPLWSASCACLTLWASGAAIYVMVRIANAASSVTEWVFVLFVFNIWRMSDRHRASGRFKEGSSYQITPSITPALTFVHQMRVSFAFQTSV